MSSGHGPKAFRFLILCLEAVRSAWNSGRAGEKKGENVSIMASKTL